MLAIAIMGILTRSRKTAVLQSHFDLNNLEGPFTKRGRQPEEELWIPEIGIDILVRNYKTARLKPEQIYNASFSLMDNQLNLYPGTKKGSREVYEMEAQRAFNAVVDKIEECHDNVFIDVASGYSENSRSILENADVAVINLSQNRYVLERYFERPLHHEKIVYLIGDYNTASSYSLRNLEKIYPRLKGRTGVIPITAGFLDAQNDGRIIPFLLKNLDCTKDSKNYEFIQAVKNAADLIERKAKG